MIKILLDQGLPRSAAGLLREFGWDVQHVSERDMSRAEDASILRVALQDYQSSLESPFDPQQFSIFTMQNLTQTHV